jgi:hypothetical protein
MKWNLARVLACVLFAALLAAATAGVVFRFVFGVADASNLIVFPLMGMVLVVFFAAISELGWQA